ncbi:MAG: bifunctional [glutamine synthetase] adenylyltransferase/[glutamine synthetase]-adenylyl-L-tyrosine phosphorylase [Parvibaculaceae bacterium]
MSHTLRERAVSTPKPYDADHANVEWQDLLQSVAGIEDSDLRAQLENLLVGLDVRPILEAIFGNSSYLTRIIRRHPDWLPRLIDADPETTLADLLTRTRAASDLATQEEVMNALRIAKAEAALLIALADVTGAWPLETVTKVLSDFADAAVIAAIEWLLRDAARRGQVLKDPAGLTAADSGLAILGMGKYGGFELNYSSDIDIVVFFEPGQLPLKDGLDHGEFFVKLTKALVKIMQERTDEGYVFRTDLRLRPDPGGTPIAVSLPAAENYYESRGQNWERAAFIKARAVAGDFQAGERFLKMLTPYIWRKNLDYAAIDDIHSMKRQIHAVGGHSVIAVAGHNIKLGRGGIREIEFFVQTQQLIAGGRDRELRGRQTVVMLDELAKKQWIAPEAAEEMQAAYRFLRGLEHRLQMIADEQTHSLPSSEQGLDHVACFYGFPDREAFAEVLTGHMRRVQGHYAKLFESAPPLGEGGSLVFTGTEDDPETLETLRGMGFTQVSEMAATIRGWHTGRFAATRSPRSRELLTSLMPALLKALSKTSNPDTAFTRFDQFLTKLGAGVQLFSMLYSNTGLLDLLAGICGTAPRLASYLAQNAAVLEAVVDPNFFTLIPDAKALHEGLENSLSYARDYQDVLDFARVFAREHRFRLGVRVLSGNSDAEEVGPAYAALATELVIALAAVAEQNVAERFGQISGGAAAVVAMGKLGSEEMSASSDLDLIVIYDVEDPDAQSDGAKPLYASQYYARVSQQLVGALTAPTTEGKLYEVDLRLRPSGNSGPIATHFDSFVSYQTSEAWTWEHMALTRARVLTGPDYLKTRITKAIDDTLRRHRDVGKTAFDIADMRERVEREFPSKEMWNLKYVRGGLVDLEFICQYLQLVHAHKHPEVLQNHTRDAFLRIADAHILPAETAAMLVEAIALTHNLTQVVRICVEGVFKPEEATPSLKGLLARAGNAPNFEVLEAQLRETQANVYAAFEAIVVAAATPQ